jgi:hypothetical protein
MKESWSLVAQLANARAHLEDGVIPRGVTHDIACVHAKPSPLVSP